MTNSNTDLYPRWLSEHPYRKGLAHVEGALFPQWQEGKSLAHPRELEYRALDGTAGLTADYTIRVLGFGVTRKLVMSVCL